MAQPRSMIVNRDVSGCYHCFNRCVRQAYLCGDGFEHRKDWVRDRIRTLAESFAIDVVGYSVESNHFHIILRPMPEETRAWTDTDVAERWLRINARTLDPRDVDEEGAQTSALDKSWIAERRRRLSDLSWFMRFLDECIARLANAEEERTGRFWESRFQCKPLLDEAALLACAVYVDANEVRAGIAATPEDSDYTSIQDRIIARQKFRKGKGRRRRHAEDGLWIVPIERRRDDRGRRRGLFDMTVDEYLAMVDATGRAFRAGKAAIDDALLPILQRLEIDTRRWVDVMGDTGRQIGSAVGSAASRAAEAARRGTTRVIGAMNVYADLPPPA